MTDTTIEKLKHLYSHLDCGLDLSSVETINSTERAVLTSLWKNEKYLEERYLNASLDNIKVLYDAGYCTKDELITASSLMTEPGEELSLKLLHAVIRGESITGIIKETIIASFDKVVVLNETPPT